MAILQNKKQSDLEKRLKQLNQQLYGASAPATPYSFKAGEKMGELVKETRVPSGDLGYLRQDLMKILFLSVLAFGFQFLLYFGIKYNLIKLPI